jgi:hypothetical protein
VVYLLGDILIVALWLALPDGSLGLYRWQIINRLTLPGGGRLSEWAGETDLLRETPTLPLPPGGMKSHGGLCAFPTPNIDITICLLVIPETRMSLRGINAGIHGIVHSHPPRPFRVNQHQPFI